MNGKQGREIQGLFNQAFQHHQAGRLQEAAQLYQQVLARFPGHAESLNLFGLLAYQAGRHDMAADLIGKAVAVSPGNASYHANLGLALKAGGGLDGAVASYRRALELAPERPETHLNLGNALMDGGRGEEAEAHFRKALALRPDLPEAHMSLGAALMKRGAPEEAAASFRRALELRPDWPEALHNLGNALHDCGRLDEATASRRRAAALRPDWPELHFNLGNGLKDQGALEEALAAYRQALSLRPDWPEGWLHLGNALMLRGSADEAAEAYGQALALRRDWAQGWTNLGNALRDLGRDGQAVEAYRNAVGFGPDRPEAHYNLAHALKDRGAADRAMAHYREAVAVGPECAEAHYNLGIALNERGEFGAALDCFGRAAACRPDYGEALIARCMAQIPILCASEAEIAERREAFARELARLEALAGEPRTARALGAGVGALTPFFLAYHGLNDRDLQSRYGALVCRLMEARFPPIPLAPPPAPGEKVRIGIVCAYFRAHSVWKNPVKGWVKGLDRRRFRLFGYHTGRHRDADTADAAALFERFVQGPLSLAAWRDRIAEDRPHILLYPEIGMDAMAARLAALRLAPVQCNSFGHPETSGYPTMDYYLGSALMEPGDADAHYTERLIRLPNLAARLEPLAAPVVPATRAEYGLRPEATVYWSGQSLFKYLPRHDEIFARIAAAVGGSQFVFLESGNGPAVTATFKERLRRAFSAHGLDADAHCVFLSRLPPDRFGAAIGLCDVFLDSIGWSGLNTTMESLVHDLPIVSHPGPLMRGRHGHAILTLMGVTETLADTLDSYVGIASRLARDTDWRDAVRAKIGGNKHRLHHDGACIEALEAFLTEAARLPVFRER